MSRNKDEENQGVKVKDQRRFNPDGSLRSETTEETEPPEQAEEAREKAPGGEAPAGPSASEASQEQGGPPLPADFVTLILSLASTAQMGLGVAPHPGTGQVEKNLMQAKHSIDLLAVLEEKTKGNLNKEEGQLLEALLGDLRMRYVEEKKKG